MYKIRKEEIKKYKPGTQSILRAAFNHGVTVYKFLENERIFILKKKNKTFWVRGPRVSIANPVSLWLIKDKFLTKGVLKILNIPYPQGFVVQNEKELIKTVRKIGFPLVIKPLRHEGGKGVFLNINKLSKAIKFFKEASKYDKHVLVEEYVKGKYYRITTVDGKIVGVLETAGIQLKGDGQSSIRELIEKRNKHVKEKYKITNKTKDILAFQNLSLSSKPSKNKTFFISFSGAEGGVWKDKTDNLSKTTAKLIEKLVKYLDLKVAGIDLIAEDISLPINSVKSPGYVLEINGAPEFLFHLSPTEGKIRDVGEAIIKMLFK